MRQQRENFEDKAAFEAACSWVCQSGSLFWHSRSKAGKLKDCRRHPDSKSVELWLHEIGAASDVDVIWYVALHVIVEWEATPARTASAHRKLYLSIEATAKRMDDLMQSTGGGEYLRGLGHGLSLARVWDFFTDEERDRTMRSDTKKLHPWGYYPTVSELLTRIADVAAQCRARGPLHSQPTKRGALNGYFIRRMNALIELRYQRCPHEVLAAIASVALGVPTTVDLVKKALKLRERSKPRRAQNVL